MFTWYWLAGLCERERIVFVLGHALYMRAMHGGKAKNDRIDAHKIAALLRGGMMPQAYVYPRPMRATRDLMRRRNERIERFPRVQDFLWTLALRVDCHAATCGAPSAVRARMPLRPVSQPHLC